MYILHNVFTHNPHHVPYTVFHILHTMCGVHCPTSHHSMVQWTVHRTRHVLRKGIWLIHKEASFGCEVKANYETGHPSRDSV